MSTTETRQKEFLLRYYRWASSQWLEEIQRGFPLLQAFSGMSSAALIALEVFEALAQSEREAMARALVKRSHSAAVKTLGDDLNAADQAALARWQDACRRSQAFGDASVKTSKTDRRRLRSALRRLLGDGAGRETKALSRAGLGYVKSNGGWSVETHFDLGGRTHQLAYDHAAFWNGQLVKSGISALAWLGISTTALDQVSLGDEERAAGCVSDLVRRFLEADSVVFVA